MTFGYIVGMGSNFVAAPGEQNLSLTRNRKNAHVFNELPNVELAKWSKNVPLDLYALEMEKQASWRKGKVVDKEDERLIAIWDFDSTLAECPQRKHFIQQDPPDWESFVAYENVIKDEPIQQMVDLNRALGKQYNNIILTARRESDRPATHYWLLLHQVEFTKLIMHPNYCQLPDYEFKRQELLKLGKENVALAFDDRDRVVQMYREEGIRCLQVDYGNF